jgi:HD-GYP domain-containing protein (c-di-GMP phosphodiesterase class II)
MIADRFGLQPREGPYDSDPRVAEYELLLDVSVKLAGTLDLATVLELAMETAEEICRAETSSVWELDEETGDLFFRVVRGRAARDIRGLRVPLGEGIVGSVARSGKAEVVNDVALDPRWQGDVTGAFQTRSILAVPLLARGKVIGVVQLLNPVDRERFTGADLWRMRQFAAILAPTLQNARLYASQRRQFFNMVTALADTLDKRDPYTGGHVRRVVGYAVLLGTEMGLSREELRDLRLASTLHDIGKITTPDRVLGKPSYLDDEEMEIMRRHAADGADIVSHLANPWVVHGVRSHHERPDGKGYPDGLTGEQIALAPRIIAVADTYDAMTTSRPYRAGLPAGRAAEEILAGAGTQFCREVVAAFQKLFESGRFSHEEAAKALGAIMEADQP